LLSHLYSGSFTQREDIWKDEKHAKLFVEWLKNKSENEIEYVHNIVSELGFPKETLTKLFSQYFPMYNWGEKTLQLKKSQHFLKERLQQLFPVEGNILT
jgi:hypothetical protein